MLNAAVFYEQIDDYQYFFVDAAERLADHRQHRQGRRARSRDRGAAAASRAAGTCSRNLGINDSEIKELAEFPQFEGNKAPKNTDWTGVIGTQYRGADWRAARCPGSAASTLQHAGDKYWQIDNVDVQDPRDVPESAARSRGERWSVYLWGKNVTDERAYSEFAPREFSGLDVDIGYLTQPRTYGVDFNLKF